MMRVDQIPVWARPWFSMWGQITGAALFALIVRQRRNIHFMTRGPGRQTSPAIYVIWHEDLIPLFLSMPYLHQPQIWMNHPAWYMKPIHCLLARMGVHELCLGSTGHRGQEALSQLAARLMATHSSTMLAVDGPAGPAYRLRKGCLYLAQRTGMPIVPLSFVCDDVVRLPIQWDRKRSPRSGTTVEVHFHAPIYVYPTDDIITMAKVVVSALNALP